MKFKDFGIAKKLGFGFGLVCLILLLLGGASMRGMNTIGNDMVHTTEYTLPVTNRVADLEHASQSAIMAMQNFIMNGQDNDLAEGRRQLALALEHLDSLTSLHREYAGSNSDANQKGREVIDLFSRSMDLSERQIHENIRNQTRFDVSGQEVTNAFHALTAHYETLQEEAQAALEMANELKHRMGMMRLHLTASALFDSEDSFRSMEREHALMQTLAKGLKEKEANSELIRKLDEMIQVLVRYRETGDAWLAAFRSNPAEARRGRLARELQEQGNVITALVEAFLEAKNRDVTRIFQESRFVSTLTQDMAQMRVLEKTYILDRNEENRNQWLAYYATLSQNLETSRHQTTASRNLDLLTEVSRHLQQYRQHATAWVNNRLILENETLPELENRGALLLQLASQASDSAWQQFYVAAENTKRIVRRALWGISLISLLGLGFALASGYSIARGISRPIQTLVATAEGLATGDMTGRSRLDQKDEIGKLAKAIDRSMDQLSGVIRQVKGGADTLAGASEELSTVSRQLASGSEEVTAQASNVASATEQMSTNISTMASATEEMSVNIQGISSTAEQMSTNMKAVTLSMDESSEGIRRIAENADTNTAIATKAIRLAGSATATMNLLGNAAKEIGDVTEVIKRIAEQTNLLALNATIEAASAGEAGRGFAVVASEIKALASQSAHAAENIAAKIRGVQETTGEAVKGIADVSGIITDISNRTNETTEAVKAQTRIAETISSNIAEATSGIQHIATGIAEVAQGANDMSRNAGEAAQAARDIAANIQGVSAAAQQSSAAASQVNSSAVDLSRLAGDLRHHMAAFKTES
ncbi:methyl-accepting chemotaxis protein [Desulfobotulus sp. H1]|uniref:Methyl-accepting chemotaxis protein n=1 Tax=Desulfobotulus pelophilus TaxID=2823377 RepID=A0ABT3NAC2_9BACT|nr:methyl-accepting chemotaxis protein [Desulfobotulus pelophilus]